MSELASLDLAEVDIATSSMWFFYVLECADGSLYAGVTTDPLRRLGEHNGLRPGGARYTRSRRPVTILHIEERDDRSDALRREAEFKRMSRKRKLLELSACSHASPVIQSIPTLVTPEKL